MPSNADDRISGAARAAALTVLFFAASAVDSHAEDKSATASLFDPHLTMPGQREPTFMRPQAAPLAPPSMPASTGSAATHPVAAVKDVSPKPSGAAQRPAAIRSAAKLGSGRASWYQHPGRTANGETFRPDALTAAHHTLPLGSRVRVVNTGNGRSVVVRITDRTNQRTQAKRPYVIDLSRGSARALGISGLAQVALYKAE